MVDSTAGIVSNLSDLLSGSFNTKTGELSSTSLSSIELESRINVTRYQWLTLFEYLSRSERFKLRDSVRLSYKSYNIPRKYGVELRDIMIRNLTTNTTSRQVMFKTKISTIEKTRFKSSEYPIDISISREVNASPSEISSMQAPRITRSTLRWNFVTNGFLVTMMKVEKNAKDAKAESSESDTIYEQWIVEIESDIAFKLKRTKKIRMKTEVRQNVDETVARNMASSRFIVNDLLKFTRMLYTKSAGSQMSYSKTDIENIKRHIQHNLPPPPKSADIFVHDSELSRTVPSYVFNKAIDLTTEHLSVDYMIKGDYRMTVKADGERKLLLFLDGGIYLISPYDRINKIASWNNKNKTPINGIILDGELLTRNEVHTDTARRWTFFVIDCLLYMNNEDVRSMIKTERMKRASGIIDIIKTLKIPDFEIVMKQFYPFSDPSSFFDVFENLVAKDHISRYGTDTDLFKYETRDLTPNSLSMLMKRITTETILNYSSDGIVFEPFNRDYYRKARIAPGEKHMPILKWKPQEVLTVDLYYNSKTGKVYASSQGDNKIEFTGTPRFPFNGQVVFPETSLLHLRPFDIVFEFALYPDPQGKGFGLRYYRDRMDKELANNINVALKVWSSMNNPLTWDDVTGKTVRMMTSYHNKIKRSMLGSSEGKILLDIGSGKGADISKWYFSEFDTVYAVEPDPNNFAELTRRLKNRRSTMTDQQKLKTSIITINAPVQDKDTIKKHLKKDNKEMIKKIDTIAMFNSTTYFWKDRETFLGLIDVITDPNIVDLDNLKILYLSLDGDSVIQLLWPRLRQFVSGGTNHYENSLFSIDVLDWQQGKIKMNIHGTLVQDQTEWLPVLGNLTKALSYHGIVQEYRRRADKENFMAVDATQLSMLYSYGVYRTAKEGGMTRLISSRMHMRRTEEIQTRKLKERHTKDMLVMSSQPYSDIDIRDIKDDEIWAVEVPSLIPDSKRVVLKGVKKSKTERKSKVERKVPKTHPRGLLKSVNVRDVIPVQERIGVNIAEYDDYISPIGKFKCRDSVKDSFKDTQYVYRVGCIQSMLSLLHSILKATDNEYKKDRSYANRRCLAFRFYRELVANGYPDKETSFNHLTSTFSVPALDRIEEICDICLTVVQSMTDNSLDILYMNTRKIDRNPDRFIIVVNYSNSGYELVGIRSITTHDRINDFQPLFERRDGFLRMLVSLNQQD